MERSEDLWGRNNGVDLINGVMGWLFGKICDSDKFWVVWLR